MTSIISIFVVYTLILVFFFKRPGYVLCYIILFTSLNNILLEQIGAVEFRFIIGFVILVFYFVVYFKPSHFNRNILETIDNKLFWGVLSIPVLMISSLIIFGGVSDSGIQYSIKFATSTFFYFLVVLIFIQKKIVLSNFIDAIVIWGLVYYISLFLFVDFKLLDITDRYSLVDTEILNPITLGRFSGILFIVGILQLLHNESKIVKVLSTVLIIISIYWMLIASTRQIFIGIALVLSLYGILKFNLKKSYILSVTILLLLLTIFFFYIDISQFGIIDRFFDLRDIESHKRYNDYVVTYSIFIDNTLFGIGQHGYQDLMGRYPHSFFLEMVASFGLLGIVTFSLISMYGFYYSIQILNNNKLSFRYYIISTLWMYYYVSIMISGDLNINREFWIISALLILAVAFTKKENN